MTNKLFGPLTYILSRLRYRQKFVLILFVFLIPLALFEANLLVGNQQEIQQLKSEQVGLDQIRELIPFMLQVQQHRGHANGYLHGDKAAKEKLEADEQEIARLTAEIDAGFRKEVFPKSYNTWTAVKEEWESIRGSYEELDVSISFKRHSGLIDRVLKLITYVADESGLSMDSEYESHYMMKLAVEELPALIEKTDVIRGLGNGVLTSRVLPDSTRADLVQYENDAKAMLDTLNDLLAEFQDSEDSALAALMEPGQEAAKNVNSYLALLDIQILNKDSLSLKPDIFYSYGTTTIESLTGLFDLNAGALNNLLQERIDRHNFQQNVTMLITLAVLLVMIFIFIAFYKNVVDTVNALRQRAEAMAGGDFSRDVVLNTRDELQLIGIAFNDMQRSLNQVLGNQQKMAETTFRSSQQLSDISLESTAAMQQVAASLTKVSEGTAAQDRTIAETTTAMNEMTTGVMKIAQAASEVANLALRTNEFADHGNQQLEESVKQMASIKRKQEESSRIAAKLEAHSSHIGNIINIILELAKQTKMLALNANIEAARAGVHGRGFAVVAQEVGKLADQTAHSGRSIAELLNDIQSLVGEVVSAMNQMQTETDLGMESIERSKTSFDRILGAIRQVSEQIQEVSATSQELSAEMEEVSASISEIAGISHKTSQEAEIMARSAEEQLASMEKIQRSAKELEEMSRKLREDLSRFVLRDSA